MHQSRPLRREYRQHHVQHDSVVHEQYDLHVGDRCWVLFGRSSRQTMHQPRPLRREYRQHVQHDSVIHDQHDLHVGDRSRVLFGRSSGQSVCCCGRFFRQNVQRSWCEWHSNRHLQHWFLSIRHGGFEFGVFGMHQPRPLRCPQRVVGIFFSTCSEYRRLSCGSRSSNIGRM